IPELQQAFLVGVAVLYHQSGDAFRVQQRQPVPDRRSVVHHVERVFPDLQLIEQLVDEIRHVGEGVREVLTIRKAALAVARVIRGDQAKRRGQSRNQLTKHVGRRRKPVQQQ